MSIDALPVGSQGINEWFSQAESHSLCSLVRQEWLARGSSCVCFFNIGPYCSEKNGDIGPLSSWRKVVSSCFVERLRELLGV